MQTTNSHDSTNKRANILLVDDEPSIRNSITEILELTGFSVIQAENGLRALEIYEDQGASIDLVLLDMTMPALSGLETLHRLREQNSDLSVILFSGYDDSQVESQPIDMSKISFLKKPFKVEALLKCIEENLP
jgi:DNA-binding NtrC family response regulator